MNLFLYDLMEYFLSLGLIIFAFTTSISPGPNNYMIFSYGKKYGIKGSLPILLGSFMGFFALLYLSGYGVGLLITQNIILETVFKVVSSIWLIYLAFILRKVNLNNSDSETKKVGFWSMFLMQFINPKAWIMAISGASAYLPKFENFHISIFVFASIFCLVGLPCLMLWLVFGDFISKILKSEKSNRILGDVLFVLMVVSTVMIWV